MVNPKIVFLDWSGTLSKSKFWGHLEVSDSDLFIKLENNLFKKNIDLLKPWMRGETTSEDIIRQISDETHLKYKNIFEEFIKGCKQMRFVDSKIPFLVKQLQKKGTKVYVATDNMDSFDRWTVPAMKLDELFDGIINSFPIKALKHDFNEGGKSLFFDSILFKEGVNPDETVLIDDSEDKENKLTNYGINYRRISEKRTLLYELDDLI